MPIRFSDNFKRGPDIKIVGIGGGGGNALNRMVESKVQGVEFIAINTDFQALRKSQAHIKLQIGASLTGGLGAGGNPNIGKRAAEESRNEIKDGIYGADMVFITAGMGGGTGTGGAPIVAEIARSLNILTIGVVTRPFNYEGQKRAQQAEEGIKELRRHTDALIVIPNERLFAIIKENTPIDDAFRLADDVLRKSIQAISDIITTTGDVNKDFADVRNILSGAGEALIGIGEAEGKDKAIASVRQAIHSPLLENVSIEGAKNLLVNITSDRNLSAHETKDAMEFLQDVVSKDAHIFWGRVTDTSLINQVRTTVIATGFPAQKLQEKNEKIKRQLDREDAFHEILKPAYLRFKCRILK